MAIDPEDLPLAYQAGTRQAPAAKVAEEMILIRAAIDRGAVKPATIRALFDAVWAGLDAHPRSLRPASRGEHRGEHFCTACSTSVDDQMLYVLWPCQTWQAIAGQLLFKVGQ